MRILEVSLVRHAPSVHGPGIVPPRDPEADTGDTPAIKALAGALPSHAIWWVSPMRRCRMTAEAILGAGAKAESVVYDDRLVEQDYGEYHGMRLDDVWDRVKDGPRSDWHFLHPEHQPPGGESYAMLRERSKPVVADIEARGAGHLVVVGHAMVIRSLLAHTLGFCLDQSLALEIDNLSLTELAYRTEGSRKARRDGWNGGWMLRSMNRVFRR